MKQTQSPDLSAWCDLKSSHILQAQQCPAGITVEGILNKSNFAGSSSSHKLNFSAAWGWCIFCDILLRKGCGFGSFCEKMIIHLGGLWAGIFSSWELTQPPEAKPADTC